MSCCHQMNLRWLNARPLLFQFEPFWVTLCPRQPINPLFDDPCDNWDFEMYEDDVDRGAPSIPEADFVDAAGKTVLQQSFTDTLINAEVLLLHDESTALATVLRRTVDENGRMIGTYNDNPLLNMMVYD